jgi:stearoyl-CoA desaturase (delta-9 desaturase)
MLTQRWHQLEILALVIVPLLGTIAAMSLAWSRYFFVRDLVILLVAYFAIGLGVTIGYHRMITHQSFTTSAPLKALILIIGCMSFEGSPITWAATHLKHHAHSDDHDDPHSPLKGFWHAHMGWLFSLKNFADPKRYVPHLIKDPVIKWVDDYALLWLFSALFIPFLLSGWTGLLWGGVVRIFLTTHITWSVNSVCHTFGRRAFVTTDRSHNNWVVGLLGFGEGWHNNHHAFPASAFHGLYWWQFDLSGIIIGLLERCGLVWEVKRVKPEILAARVQRGIQQTQLVR